MPQCSLPQLPLPEQEQVRIRLQECGVKSYSSAPPCPHGVAKGVEMTCDCQEIKADAQFGIQDYTCLARIPCPVRVLAGLPTQREG